MSTLAVEVAKNHNCSTNKYKTKYEEPGRQILILYGTEYGFSEEVARKVFDAFKENDECTKLDIQPRVVNARDYRLIEFDKEQVVLFVFSTTGDGGYHLVASTAMFIHCYSLYILLVQYADGNVTFFLCTHLYYHFV